MTRFIIRRAWPLAVAVTLVALSHATVPSLLPAALPPEPTDVWIDVDPGTGQSDVDDGLMLLQCLHSPELRIRGVSVVFGNAPLPHGLKVAGELLDQFGPPGLRPQAGAASADQLGQVTAAVEALAHALQDRPLTILAVGPVTNVATLVTRHPDLQARIQRIVMVAGRRPGQRFLARPEQAQPFRDFNFELDPTAMQAILDTRIPLVLAPWEISSHVWITRDDLRLLAQRSASGRWIAETSEYWITRWEQAISPRGFNPFDSLAAAWLTHPQLIESQMVTARIVEAPDDRAPRDREPVPRKPYLVVEPLAADSNGEREIVYCHHPHAALHQILIDRLAGQGN